MTEHERLMYQIMGSISKSGAPLVFKGALIAKLVLAEYGFTSVNRPTIDIDANWIDAPPTMSDLNNIVNRSLEIFNGELYSEATREYGDKKSAGISVKETKTGNKIISIDISVKPVHGSRIYHYGEIDVRGVLPNEILSDKITVLSTKMIFRRAKDVVDVYALARCVRVRTSEIYEIFRNHPERKVGVFDEFYNRRGDVEHAYNMLKGIEGKPPFDDVYLYLSKFVRPFAMRDETPMVWNSAGTAWEGELNKETEKLSVGAAIRADREARRKRSERNDTYKQALDLWRGWHVATVPDVDLRLSNFRILFAYNSGKIENDEITYYDTREIFENGRVVNFTGDPRSVFELGNQKLCYEFLKHKIAAREPLTIPLVLEAHSILTSGTYDERRYIERGERPGSFKRHDYVTGREEVGALPEDVPADMDELLGELSEYANGDALKAAAYFHARFEYIHPFADGNGRTGRTLMNYFLMLHDHPPLIVYDEDKDKYYAALERYDADEDIAPMYDFLRSQTEKTWSKTLEREARKTNGAPSVASAIRSADNRESDRPPRESRKAKHKNESEL